MRSPTSGLLFAALAVMTAALPAAAAIAPGADSADLFWQLSPNVNPDQGPSGLCHDFAASALVEAA
jgi:hypothetical protein